MTQLTNTFDTFTSSASNKESIHNIISMIDPSDTPMFSMLNKGAVKSKAAKEEWTQDSLRAFDGSNAEVQGFTYNFNTTNAPDKVGNYHTLFSDSWRIAKTQEAVDKVGRQSDVVRAKRNAGMSLRIDMEGAILANQASVAGSGAVPARMGGLAAWVTTNTTSGSGGSVGGYNTSTGVVDASTNGDQRAFTKALLDNALQAAYTSGGKPRCLMASPYVKRVFSSLIGDSDIASLQTNTSGDGAATLIGAVDAYRSDFGLVNFVPNVQLPAMGASYARNAFLIDKSKARLCWLRRIQEDKDVAHVGDSIDGVMLGEMSLKVDNEKAHAIIPDLYGLTAST